MDKSALFYLGFTLLLVFAQGFFSMFEMAAVSFNRVRLQYYVSQNQRLAIWLNALLNRPSRLFGTTLLAVNTLLQFGSEFSRRFYESIHIDPVFAPLSQIFIVLIFGELAPMFAARRYSEQVALLYIPVVYFISLILTPLTWLIDGLNHFLHRCLGKSAEMPLFLSRDEIQRAFEENEESESLNVIIRNFFTLKNKTAQEVMLPISTSQLIPSQSTVEEMRHVLSVNYSSFIPIYHQNIHNIVAIAYPRGLLKVEPSKKVIDFAKPPWFITEKDSVVEILKQFRRNNRSNAVVLNQLGEATGVLTLSDLVDEIFGEVEDTSKETEENSTHFEMTISGEMSLLDFNEKFHTNLECASAETISDYITKTLKHHPVKGEQIKVGGLEFTVVESYLFGAKTVSVKTI